MLANGKHRGERSIFLPTYSGAKPRQCGTGQGQGDPSRDVGLSAGSQVEGGIESSTASPRMSGLTPERLDRTGRGSHSSPHPHRLVLDSPPRVALLGESRVCES